MGRGEDPGSGPGPAHLPASLSGSFSVADLLQKKPCELCALPVLIPSKDKNLPND